MAKQIALTDSGKGFEFTLIELVVGKESGKGVAELSKQAKGGQTLVSLGYVPVDYLLNLKPPRNRNELSNNEVYLSDWVKRACLYPNPPVYMNVSTFFSTLGEISREAVQLGMPKDSGFTLGMSCVPETVVNTIIKGGFQIARKFVSDPNSDFEQDVMQQLVLTHKVAQIFGVALRRVAQPELYATIDCIREALIKSQGVASLKGCGEELEAIVAKYERLTRLLGDPLPFKRLPQYNAR